MPNFFFFNDTATPDLYTLSLHDALPICHVLSLQYHNKKDESIYVLKGEIVLRVQQGDTLIERPLREGESFHIQPKVIHQFEAVLPSDLLEASTPEIDDVVRLKDRYGRV